MAGFPYLTHPHSGSFNRSSRRAGSHETSGCVHLVGAGPGDPELITVRGLRLIQQAEVLVYDRLVHPDLVAEAPAEAERIYVGKAPGRNVASQEEIEALLVSRAQAGKRVVRLKGGDPFVFGRGAEEALTLTEAGISWDVVPAVTSAVGVPAQASIPVTFRGVAADFAVVTGHRADGFEAPDWQALTRVDTLVILMGISRLPVIAARLIEGGLDAQTPAAIIERGTWENERVHVTTLEDLPVTIENQGVRSPATVIVGRVVELRERLASRRLVPSRLAAVDDLRLHPTLPSALPTSQGVSDDVS